MDNASYHDRILTIVWDKAGEKYEKGKGLQIFADGKLIARRDTLGRLTGCLTPTD